MNLEEQNHGNPYIVGTPIRSNEMFFGREKEFKEIRNILIHENQGLVLTLAGERRIGKTSILFQILNGWLGDGFTPFFIDMQAMAGIRSTTELLQRMADTIRGSLSMEVGATKETGLLFSEFEAIITEIQKRNQKSKIVFLVDEYEIFEKMIEDGRITPDIFQEFKELMETYCIFFIFAGSNTIENRKPDFWKTIHSRSFNLKISYLDVEASRDLISKPLKDSHTFSGDTIERIIRLTAGHPFYIQLFCHNLVELLVHSNRTVVEDEDIEFNISEILKNTLYSMIYFWQALSIEQKIVLSILSQILPDQDQRTGIADIRDCLNASSLDNIISDNEIELALQELKKKLILSEENQTYSFNMDFLRFWVQHEQNIWNICEEYQL